MKTETKQYLKLIVWGIITSYYGFGTLYMMDNSQNINRLTILISFLVVFMYAVKKCWLVIKELLGEEIEIITLSKKEKKEESK